MGEVIARALQIAASDPAGPVYLTLPREVLMTEVRRREAPGAGTDGSGAPGRWRSGCVARGRAPSRSQREADRAHVNVRTHAPGIRSAREARRAPRSARRRAPRAHELPDQPSAASGFPAGTVRRDGGRDSGRRQRRALHPDAGHTATRCDDRSDRRRPDQGAHSALELPAHIGDSRRQRASVGAGRWLRGGTAHRFATRHASRPDAPS